MLAQKNCKRRHDKVCSHLHWCLSRKYGLDVDRKWYHHKPDKVVENDVINILWDYNIQTDRIIEHRIPDVTIVDKARRKCLIVDVAMPGDQNITKKEFEKINNYSELRVEIARVWNMETEVVPVVIGALGSIPKNLHYHLESLGIKVSTLQKSVLLGTANILQKVLSV